MCFNLIMNRLSEYRTLKGMSQSELGARLNPPLKQAGVSNHEVGVRTPDVYQAIRYASALGTSVETLFPLDADDVSCAA